MPITRRYRRTVLPMKLYVRTFTRAVAELYCSICGCKIQRTAYMSPTEDAATEARRRVISDAIDEGWQQRNDAMRCPRCTTTPIEIAYRYQRVNGPLETITRLDTGAPSPVGAPCEVSICGLSHQGPGGCCYLSCTRRQRLATNGPTTPETHDRGEAPLAPRGGAE